MNMAQRGRRISRQWAVLFVQLILLHALLMLGWVALDPGRTRDVAVIILLMISYLAALTLILIRFFKRVGDAGSPPEYREAVERGIPATAKVLEIARTRWRIERYRNLRFQSRPTRFEYQMRLRVSKPGEPDYEAFMAEFLSGNQVPQKGDVIAVKVHPQRPDVIVMVLDTPTPKRT